MRNHVWLILLSTLLSSCGESPARDSDGDGLSDHQEKLLCTFWDNEDSDGDGILDGEDPDPCPVESDNSLSLNLAAGKVTEDAGGGWSTVVTATTSVGGEPVAAALSQVQSSPENCQLAEFDEADAGTFTALLTSPMDGVCTIEATATTENGLLDSDRTDVYFLDLPRPGLAPPPYHEIPPLDGAVRVFVVHGNSITDPDQASEPVKQAYVQVQLTFDPESKWEAYTDETGIIEFEATEFKTELLSVTVAKAGFKAFTVVGTSASFICLPLSPFDPIPGVDTDKTGSIEGAVFGFDEDWGEPPFGGPNLSLGGRWSIGMIQVGLKNVDLVSLSMSSVLHYGDAGKKACNSSGEEGGTLFDCIPPNMVIYGHDKKAPAFSIHDLPPGEYLVTVVAGDAYNVPDTLSDPYRLRFVPRALGLNTATVKEQETTQTELHLQMDLLKQKEAGIKAFQLDLGGFPVDPATSEPLANGLVMPVLDTGKYGYIWVDVNGSYQDEDFENPIEIVYPDPEHEAVKSLGLDLFYMTVALAGRKSYLGADPPGISTVIIRDQEPGEPLDMTSPELWLKVPRGLAPEPPDRELPLPCSHKDAVQDPPGWCVNADDIPGHFFPLDRAGGALDEERTIEWIPVTTQGSQFHKPGFANLYAVRIGYLVPPPRNPMTEGYAIGGPESHKLWEFIVPEQITKFHLPVLPGGLYGDAGLLVNPAPSAENQDEVYKYDANTLEIEFNAYLINDGKEFDYNRDFSLEDMNLHSGAVSQDSYPFRVVGMEE